MNKLILMCSLTLCILSTSVNGQRLKNAFFFKTDSARDKLVDETLISLPSNELLVYQPSSALSPNQARIDGYRTFDFALIPNDPDASLGKRNGYFFEELDSLGTDPALLPATPEAAATIGDFDGDGRLEVVRAMEDDNGEILCFLYDELALGLTQADSNFQSASTMVHRVPEPASGYQALLPGYQSIKLQTIRLDESEQDHFVLSYLRRLNDSLYQLHLDVWQNQVIASYSLDLPFARIDNFARISPEYDLAIADFELDGVPELVVIHQSLRSIQYGSVFDDSSFVAFVDHQLTILKFEDQQLSPVYQRKLAQTNTSAIDVLANYSSSGTNRMIKYASIKTKPLIRTRDLNGDNVPELFTLYPISYVDRTELSFNGSSANIDIFQQMYLRGDMFAIWEDSMKPGIHFFDTLQHIGRLRGQTAFANTQRSIPVSGLDQFYHDIQFAADADIGDLDGDGQVEFCYGLQDFYQDANRSIVGSLGFGFVELDILPTDSVITTQTIQQRSFVPEFVSHPAPRDFLTISDLDGDEMKEFVIIRNQSSQETMEVWRYTSSGTNPQLVQIGSEPIDILPNTGSIHLLDADLDRDGIRVGKPRYFQRTGIQQPLVILNAPPIHFDQFGNEIFEINGCYLPEFPQQDCEFSATYTNSSTTSFTATTEFRSDWSVSAAASVSAEAFVSKVEAKLTSSYGQSFSNIQNNGKSISIGTTVEASIEDRIYASVMQYGIYEYPIYNGDSVIAHIVTVTPELQQNRWFSTDSWSAFDYFPRHEVGNIMSYEGFFNANGQTDLNQDPTMAVQVQLLGDGLSIDNSSSYSQTISISDFSSSNTSFQSDFSIGTEASATVGKKLFGVGVEVTASVAGEYSQSNLSTFETSASNTLTLDVSMGANQSGLESNYIVSPYLYWAKNGALVLDYTVQPEVEILGGTQTFWSAKYGQKEDPALLLPFRLHPEKDLTLQEEIKRIQSRGITYAPRNAQPGDTITLFAAVHNYSLLPTDGPVKAAFYLGNPNCPGAQRLTSPDGSQIAFTSGNQIPSRGRELLVFEWVIPAGITTNPRIFVQLDPDEEIEEIHEENNLGWTILEVEGSGPSQYCNALSTSLEDQFAVDFDLQAYPNPFSKSTRIAFTLENPKQVVLEILDLTGRTIEVLANEPLGPGKHERVFDAEGLSSGIYLYRLQVEDQIQTGRLVIH